ncbi:unnamed protein product [Trichogramma brassicae]|uniref:Glucosamine 6-phosphate N-acetyltransferase n=1 Tax=Trichogramma brassicae TaxID=86971 RepID=A0A6H5IZJ2_9HYME|nr:unnamed protein product [Trichogramma brassicae]
MIRSSPKIEGIDLFDGVLLEKIRNESDIASYGSIRFRPLNSNDYDKGKLIYLTDNFLQLLSQLTEVGNVDKNQFLSRFHEMKSAGGHYVIVAEEKNTIIASATLVTEQKFIHNCALRGHLEDVVVRTEYRDQQIGRLMVSIIKHLAKQLQCYKLTLECKDRLISFYEKSGFRKEPGNGNSMNIRF